MGVVAGLVAGLSVAGCKTSAEDVVKDDATLAEAFAGGTLHWNIDADGDTRMVVTDGAGKVLHGQVVGQLTFETKAGTKTVELHHDAEGGVASVDGPDLEGEVSQVKYALVVDGKPVAGALHVPETGTKGLVEASAEAEVDAEGPHGGVVHEVDGARYEVVGDSGTGQVRVYALGDVQVRPKKVELALDAKTPRVVELDWDEGGYYVAEVQVKHPRKVTLVVVDDDDDAHVVLVGYRPGVVIALTPERRVWMVRGWKHRGLARGHYKGTAKGPPGHFQGKVRGRGKGKGH